MKNDRINEFRAPISRSWVNQFDLRHPDEIIPMKSARQKEQHLQVLRMLLKRIV
jgi:hypothetical protein